MKQITYKLITVTRQDLTPGYQTVQSAHALAEFIFKYPIIANDWHINSNFLATLAVKNESELIQLTQKLEQNNIKFVIFNEPDIDNQITAIAIEPSDASRRICSNIPLALREYNDLTLIDKHRKEVSHE